MNEVLEVKQFYQQYKHKELLRSVSFEIRKGEITALIGVNGSGKTTIMDGIMRLVPIQKGSVVIDGEENPKDLYTKVAYVTDQALVHMHATIAEEIAFMRTFYPNWNQEKAQTLLRFFNLDEKVRISSLSKGNLAKLNLLLGVSLDTDYLLMDEPFSGIDMFAKEQILQIFTTDMMENRGVMITTHEIEEIELLADKVILLNEGTVVKEFYSEVVRSEEHKSVVDIMREVYQP